MSLGILGFRFSNGSVDGGYATHVLMIFKAHNDWVAVGVFCGKTRSSFGVADVRNLGGGQKVRDWWDLWHGAASLHKQNIKV